MINLSTNENAIIFEFIDSKHYLTGNGTIEVPKSSLTLVTDDSDMATFCKSASNDIFVSAPYSEFGKTKAQLIEWFEENGFSDGGGVTPEDVEDMIDEAIAPIETEIAGKATKQELEDAERVTAEAFVEINEKLDDTYTKSEVDDAIDDVEQIIEDNELVTAQAFASLNTLKADASSVYTKTEIDTMIGNINTILASI